MPTSPSGVFTFPIPTSDLSRGLRPSRHSPRNTKFLTVCEGAVGIDNVLQTLPDLANIDTTIITDPFPYPQIFVFTNLIIVCDSTTVYELVGGTLVPGITVAPGVSWSAVDFYDYIYMSNGTVAIKRSAESKTWSITNRLPIAVAICNLNGQVIVAGSENELFSTVIPTSLPPTTLPPPTTAGPPTTVLPTTVLPTTAGPTPAPTTSPPTTLPPPTTLATTTPPTLNDFAHDRRCAALWRFESGALTTDSKGGNTLINIHSVAESTAPYGYHEGACAALFDKWQTEYFIATDASLDTWYPFKIGDDRKLFSICGWFKIDTVNDGMAVYSKWYGSPYNWRCVIPLRVTPYGFESLIGYNNGVSSELLYQGGSPQVGRWYHFGYTHNGLNRQWKLVIWDDFLGSKVVDVSGIASHYISIRGAPITIGLGMQQSGAPLYFWDGIIDEVVVFNDILTLAEIDDIRQGLYAKISTTGPATTFGPTTALPTTIIPTTLYPTTHP